MKSPGSTPTVLRSPMPKPSPSQGQPDPMSGVVDGLLAHLPGLQGEPIVSRPVFRPGSSAAIVATPNRGEASTARQWLGVWTRVLLGLTLAVMIAGWPYGHSCGLSLSGYLAVVMTVTL